MLDIFNRLKPFFEDTAAEISVRQYAKSIRVSPPTASKVLKELHKENLLLARSQGVYDFYRAHKESPLFKDLAAAFWRNLLGTVLRDIHESLLFKPIILFGSIRKAENTKESDIDLFVDIPHRQVEVVPLQKKLGRKVQLHFRDSLKNSYLKENIARGITIL